MITNQTQTQQQKQKPKRVVGVAAQSSPPQNSSGVFVFTVSAVFSEKGQPLAHESVQLKKNQNTVSAKPTDGAGKVVFTVREPLSSSGGNTTYEVGVKLSDGTEVKQAVTVSFPGLPSYEINSRGKYCPRCKSDLFANNYCPICDYPGRAKY
ncbi:hypothetical protein A3I35_02895 [Candidatus Falkowbacteria bacterium RIFCSPLOWO2_02_FULL_45_15]|uniref:Big-1 domain-containing protein n=2 Tax=Candidatus Falkowiibacteriota TaxID=1752728 RepID=A0A1F5RYQ9_9BACT|nr:MAG: hypothetical protein A3D54_04305 [Candidatus Falkowbacteria bacterium RIFCSPHIGHO2_02_FULL_45_15]OGF19518.1 MAG: hypothetical protein A3I35_02895 [Candidatus Falkowbacteria bacterium RIFCSPLOWO2_02_FULL_45_15]